MEINKLFGGIYNNRRVLVTGHTGFKGSWMSYWLSMMGAKVYGLSLDPGTSPNHFDLLDMHIESYIQDINNFKETKEIIQRINPEIIFHLAAQPLVRLSYNEPLNTLSTNIIGTANILEVARQLKDLKAIVVITSDKCYENREWVWGYRENESLGGKDPYSASKACTEIITNAFRSSFFKEEGKPLIASVRAGNVIGGGDWSADRIMTDIVQATNNDDLVYLRYPNATRPWQHVLEPLSGYLCIGWKLLDGKTEFAEAWNFGPNPESNVTVLDLVKAASSNWSKIKFDFDKSIHPHEAGFLMLDSSKARKLLNWYPIWSFHETVRNTIFWYKDFYLQNKINTGSNLASYVNSAVNSKVEWAIT